MNHSYHMIIDLIFFTLGMTLLQSATQASASDIMIDGTDAALIRLPELKKWPHRPVFLQCGSDTHATGRSISDPLPIGAPFQFESSLFKGTMLIRLRNVISDDPERNKTYFSGKKRFKQITVQGVFKENVRVSDIFYGDVYDRPLNPAPPPRLGQMIKVVMSRLVPGLIIDLASSKPKVLTLYAGCAHSLSVNLPGQEPNIIDHNPTENTVALFGEEDLLSSDKRMKKLSKPKYASKYQFDMDHVYTFNTYDDVVDIGTYKLHLPILGQYDLTKSLNGQPMSISAITRDGRFLFNFRVWHERLLSSSMERAKKIHPVAYASV